VDALILAREGTTVVPDASDYAPALPINLDDASQMDRWEPWVRAYTALGELLQGITFQASGNAAFRVLSSGNLIAEIGRPSDATFQAQVPLVLSWAELRLERATEIMAQIDPPYAFWSSIVYMRPDRTARTFELINILLQLCVFVEMRFKHAFACWRPSEHNAQVQPMITTPGHGAFPSGHSTQVHAVAHLLEQLLNLKQTKHQKMVEQLRRQAARIATNRVVAGVHYPVDSMAGRMLGVALAEYFVGRCRGSTVTQTFMQRKFNAAVIDANPSMDFNPFNTTDQNLDASPTAGKLYSSATGASITQSGLLDYVWRKACDEWSVRFP